MPSFPGCRCIFRLVFTYIRVILCRFPGVLQLGVIGFYITPCNSAHVFPDRTTATVPGFTSVPVNPHKNPGLSPGISIAMCNFSTDNLDLSCVSAYIQCGISSTSRPSNPSVSVVLPCLPLHFSDARCNSRSSSVMQSSSGVVGIPLVPSVSRTASVVAFRCSRWWSPSFGCSTDRASSVVPYTVSAS